MKTLCKIALTCAALLAGPAAASVTPAAEDINASAPIDLRTFLGSAVDGYKLIYDVEERESGVVCGKVFEPARAYGVFVIARGRLWLGTGARVASFWLQLCASPREDIGP